MKFQSILQPIRCPECRGQYPAKTCHRLMNFTSGEIFFFCHKCHKKIAFMHFEQFNQLFRNYFENPPPLIEENKTREGPRRESRGRSRFRGNRPQRREEHTSKN